MDRRTDIPRRYEYAGDSGFANIQTLASHRRPLFHSEDGHMELRVDFIPLISPLVYQGLGLFSAVHRTEHYFFSLAGDMPELSLNCSENGTRLLEFLTKPSR